MGIAANISEPPVEALDEAIFHRPAWSDEIELYSFTIGQASTAFEQNSVQFFTVID